MKDKRVGVGEFAFWLLFFAGLVVAGIHIFAVWFSIWLVEFFGVDRRLALPLFLLFLFLWWGGAVVVRRIPRRAARRPGMERRT